MAATVTLTGKVGPAITMTAQIFSNVISFTVDCVNNVIALTQTGTARITHVDINAQSTVTATKSGAVWTLSIS